MSPEHRQMARRQLDKRLNSLRPQSQAFARPPRGWVKAIREALGMTTTQFAQRLGVDQSRIIRLENGETKKTITLERLERAAHALDCQLVYALVPRQTLEETIEHRATLKAKAKLAITTHTMALEAQTIARDDAEKQLQNLARALAEKSPSSLWEEE